MSIQADASLSMVEFAPVPQALVPAMQRLADQSAPEGWTCRRTIYVAAKSEVPPSLTARNLDALTSDLATLRNMALAGCSDRRPGVIGNSAYFAAGFRALALRDLAMTGSDGWLLLGSGALSVEAIQALVAEPSALPIRWFEHASEPVALIAFRAPDWVERSQRLADAYLSGRMWGLSQQSFMVAMNALAAS